MFQKIFYSVFVFLFILSSCFGQEKIDNIKVTGEVIVDDGKIDPLSPARAAFHSAVLPGLGQVYNKKYWKVPVVIGAIGTGVYFYVNNKNLHERYQTAYKLRISGRPDEFDGQDGNPNLSTDGLIRAQKTLNKNKDLALFAIIGLYALNIIEANVDAHLDDRAFSRDLSLRPSFYMDPISNRMVTGINIKFEF